MLYLGAKKSLLSSGKTLAAQIAAIFAGGEQGAWYDPSDFSTLFQDSAGTLPVTAVGQPVGLMLDKRLGLVRGVEAWNDAAVIIGGESSRVSATAYRLYSSAGAGTDVNMPNAMIAGRMYEVAFSIDSIAVQGGGIQAYALSTPTFNTVGPKRCVITAAATTLTFKRASTACDYQISNFSVRELPGNPALQATVTARPLNQAAPARLVFDAVDDQHVTTFLSALGSNCTIVRSVPGVGASILTGQTIGTTYTNTVTHSGLLIISRALTASETISATKWANQRAFA